jgi:hypothetical protein
MVDWEMRALAAEALLAEKEQELAEMEAELELLREHNHKLQGGSPKPLPVRSAPRDLTTAMEYAMYRGRGGRFQAEFPTLDEEAKALKKLMHEMAFGVKVPLKVTRGETAPFHVVVARDVLTNNWRFTLGMAEGGPTATEEVSAREIQEAQRRRSEGTVIQKVAKRLLHHLAVQRDIPPAPQEVVMEAAHLLLRKFKEVR